MNAPAAGELTGAGCDLCRSDRFAEPVLDARDYEYGDCWDFWLFGRDWGAATSRATSPCSAPRPSRPRSSGWTLRGVRIVPRLRTLGWSTGIQNWIAERTGLRVPPNGRVRWYPVLIAPFLPVTVLQALVSRTVTMAFVARKPER